MENKFLALYQILKASRNAAYSRTLTGETRRGRPAVDFAASVREHQEKLVLP